MILQINLIQGRWWIKMEEPDFEKAFEELDEEDELDSD